MDYTDKQLKEALAKMLPDKLILVPYGREDNLILSWILQKSSEPVRNTELLHLCWLVEETLNSKALLRSDYIGCLSVDINLWEYGFTHASWQKKVIALAKVKGIEI